MRTFLAAALAASAFALSACGSAGDSVDSNTPATDSAQTEIEQTPVDPAIAEHSALEAILAGEWRGEDSARDAWRHPVETLEFLGVHANHSVVELWPGGGWYSRILAPYLAENGEFTAAIFDPAAFEGEGVTRIEARNAQYVEQFAANPGLFGTLKISHLSGQSGPIAPANSQDIVLTFRNIHNWMNGEYLDKVFADAFAALKPGGIFGVVEHRLPSASEQDPVASSGYVHEDFVIAAAERAGFVLAARSDINANPADTADHPFGVWTLPPRLRTADRDGNTPDSFDPSIYPAIGESDRMTLKFVKPAE